MQQWLCVVGSGYIVVCRLQNEFIPRSNQAKKQLIMAVKETPNVHGERIKITPKKKKKNRTLSQLEAVS